MKDLDLKDNSKKDFLAILLDLLMYKNSELVNSAFKLMVRQHSQSITFLTNLKKLQILE